MISGNQGLQSESKPAAKTLSDKKLFKNQMNEGEDRARKN